MILHIFALAAHGDGISGGDRIFIELARRWSKKFPITIYLNEEGREMCRRNKLSGKIKYQVVGNKKFKRFGFIIYYVSLIIVSLKLGLTTKLFTKHDFKSTYVYSASDFWMDTIPCVLLKVRYPKIKWWAGWYQTAPNPFKGYQEGRYKTSALFYFLSQLPIKPLVAKFADYVFVNNDTERKQFKKLNRKGRVFVFIGAVDLEKIGKWKLENGRLSKLFDAVFQGRFHPQKGVVELIDIWKKVVAKIPNAKLAMIGDGPLMEDVKLNIKNEKLEKNIKLFGYVFDGDKKYKIFAESKLVVHPAFYDSGGMASAEAMAFGIPCVGFDLPAYKSYYPQGMVKVALGDNDAFSKEVLKVLGNKKYNKKIAQQGVKMINQNWSWDKRADEALKFLNGKN